MVVITRLFKTPPVNIPHYSQPTSISPPLLKLHSPTHLSSPVIAVHEPSTSRIRRSWLPGGMPVMGSSLAFNRATVHDGLMRRSAESCGGASFDAEGTVMRRAMSGAVWRLMWLGVCLHRERLVDYDRRRRLRTRTLRWSFSSLNPDGIA